MTQCLPHTQGKVRDAYPTWLRWLNKVKSPLDALKTNLDAIHTLVCDCIVAMQADHL